MLYDAYALSGAAVLRVMVAVAVAAVVVVLAVLVAAAADRHLRRRRGIVRAARCRFLGGGDLTHVTYAIIAPRTRERSLDEPAGSYRPFFVEGGGGGFGRRGVLPWRAAMLYESSRNKNCYRSVSGALITRSTVKGRVQGNLRIDFQRRI